MSNKLKHTPGPWKFKLSLETFTIFCEKVGRAVCRGIKNESDARLISCAPEMLNELITVFKGVREYDNGGLDDYSPIRLKKLIEKATGLTIEEVLNDPEN